MRPAWENFSVRPCLEKQSNRKRTGDMAQEVEHLLSKCEVLSSIFNTGKNK
jgi:hypothetical protein